MTPAESPFPCRWESFSLEDAGLGDLRPEVFTYAAFDFFALPPLPFELRGDWNWLRAMKSVDRNIAGQNRLKNENSLRSLGDSASAVGLRLPDPFVQFFSDPGLADRVRSNTDCFLDLSPWLTSPAVAHGGYMVRFLDDSQGCLFWYLHLTANGDHAVLSSPDFYGSPSEEERFYRTAGPEYVPLARSADGMSFAAESFEAFMCRFWIENEIWFAGFEGGELPPGGPQYIEAYRSGGHHKP